MSGRIVFPGRRWPAADAQDKPVRQDVVLADGTLLSSRNFVEITTTGDGRAWTPEPIDATWRDLAELDLADPEACEAFARRRGDPSGALSAGKPQGYVSTVSRHGMRGSRPVPAVPGRVVTSRWAPLAMALQQAVRGWMPPDELGVSHPVRDQKQRTEAWRFLDQPVAQAAMQKVKVAPDPDSLAPAFKTSELDVFLIMQAWLALEHPLPMTRCQVCNSWFESAAPTAPLASARPRAAPFITSNRRKRFPMASVRKSITRKGTLRWQTVWNEPGLDGSTRQRTKNFARQSEAREHANRMAQEIEGRGVGDPQRHSVARYLQRWLTTLEARGEHSPSTLAGYRRNLSYAIRHLGHIPLEKLSPADLDELYATLLQRGGVARGNKDLCRPLSPRSVLHVHRVLFTALERARKWKLIRENPARDATSPSPHKSPVRAFNDDEVGRMFAAAVREPETYCILAVLFITGTRRSEMLGLDWDAIDLERRIIFIRRVVLEVEHRAVIRDVPKTESSERSIDIPPLLVELLREQKTRCLEAALKWGKGYRKDPMFVFARPDGSPHDPMSMTVRLRQVMRRAKVTGRAPTHGWRHTSATALIAAGVDLKTVSARLGHASPTVTLNIYAHRSDERDQAAGEHLAALLERQRKT